MVKTNGKQVDPQELDLEHELPAADETTDEQGKSAGAESSAPATDTELQRIRSERDTLLDRLARSQAEFENARKRAAKEQQEFRDFATADAIKALRAKCSREPAKRVPQRGGTYLQAAAGRSQQARGSAGAGQGPALRPACS